MPNPTPRGPASDNGGIGPPEPGVGLAELVEEVEALRAALVEATGRATRLLAGLKQQQRQSRALQAAVATIRQLRLVP